MYFWKYILAKKAGLSQKKCNMALYGLPVLPIAEAFEKTVTGNPISVTDALAQDALSLQVSFTPTQDGTPSIDSEPTTSPYLSKVIPRGNKEYYGLVGATVAWNQLVQNGDFSLNSGWDAYPLGNATLSISDNTATLTYLNSGSGGYQYGIRYNGAKNKTILGHKYLLQCYAKSTKKFNCAIDFDGTGKPLYPIGITANTWTLCKALVQVNRGNAEVIVVMPQSNSISIEENDTFSIRDVMIVDLTLMFANNPAIANYAYSLEQSEAGSGIAWLKSQGFFTKDYYPFNEGELISVNTSGHKIGSTTYPIDPTDLRGLFKLSNGKLYCEGDIYPPSGSVARKYGIVDLGELNWGRSTTAVEGQYRFNSSGIASSVKIVASNKLANIITAKYVTVKGDTGWATEIDKCVWTDHLGAVNIIDKSYTDKDTFKTAMSGQYLVYELETPTTESATPYTSPIDVEAGGTEVFIDNRTVPIPVGNETYYASEYEVRGKTGITVSHGATEDDPNPTEHEVEFTSQGTVYGGIVDIVSGVLSVNYGFVDLGTKVWNYNNAYGFYTNISDAKSCTASETANIKCKSRKAVNWNSFYAAGKKSSFMALTGTTLGYASNIYTNPIEFKTSVNGTILAYELATPQTYNLTPEQVTMLLGDNYLETEDGTITLTYMAGK